MTTTANHAEFITAQETVTVRWTEQSLDENVEMTLREFRGLLVECRELHCAEMGEESLCYCKVAFLAGGKSFRIDVNGDPNSTKLENAWLY